MPVAKGSAERVRRAYGCIQILRVLLGYGIECGIADCRRLRSDMEGMRFPRNPPRDKTMPFEQAEAFVTEALKRNETGLALAQALQFECFLRQNDVIGTWRDESEDYPLQPGEIRIGAKVWRGLTWDRLRLGDDLLIRTSKTGQPVTHAIDACALVVRCLRSRAPAPTNGPIVTRKDGLPFMDRRSYAKAWRQIATAVGLPKELWNMDTRASGITEAAEAGVSDDDLAQSAAHADKAITRRVYKRGGHRISTRVQEKRQSLRADPDRTTEER